MDARMCPSILEGIVSQHTNKIILRFNTMNLLQIPHANQKRFGDRAFFACAFGMSSPTTSMQLIACKTDTIERNAFLKVVYLTIWTINICPLSLLYEALLNITGGKALYEISITIIVI